MTLAVEHSPSGWARDSAIRTLIRSIPVILALSLASACRTSMTLEEAKQITVSFGGAELVPPPRSIDDLTRLLDPRDAADLIVSLQRIAGSAVSSSEDEPAEVAKKYFLRGKAARRIGRLGQAIEDFSQAAALVTPAMRIQEPEVSREDLYSNLGLAILRERAKTEAMAGDHWAARSHFEAAVAAADQLREIGWHFDLKYPLVELYALTGDMRGAERLVSELLILQQQSYTWPSRPFLGALGAGLDSNVASAQATMLELRGRFVGAEPYWRTAIRLLEPYDTYHWTGPWVRAKLDSSIGRLAQCLLRQGRLLEAEIEARKALRSALNRRDNFGLETAWLLNLVARILREQGRYAEARAVATITIVLYERGGASPRSSPPVVAPRLEVAATLAAESRWTAALDEYEIARKQLQDDPLYAQLTQRDSTLAFVLLRAGRINDAQATLAAALDLSRRLRGDRHSTTAELRGLRAVALAGRGEVSMALEEFAAAATVLLTRAEQVEDALTPRVEQEQRRTWILEQYIGLLSQTNGRAVAPSNDAAAEAFRLAEGARGGMVQRALGAALARSAATTPALGDLARREQDAAKQIAALQVLLVSLDDRARGAERDLRGRIEALERARLVLVQEISRKFPAYTELINPRPATIENARTALRSGEALLATYVGEERTYVWAVPKTGAVAFAVVPLGVAAIGRSVATLRKALDSGARLLQDVPAFDVDVAHDLYRQILEPVKYGWESANSLIVIGHGPLAQIPWTLLPMRGGPLPPERAPLFSNYRAIPWLVRTHAVTMVPSVSTLVTLRTLPRADPHQRPFVGFGDPYFSATHAQQGPAERVATLARRDGLVLRDVMVSPGAEVLQSRLGMLPRLPDTAEEIRAIARALGADEARDVFLGIAANEHTVKQLELSRYRVIAFATHGLVPGDIDGFTQPALALTAPEIANVEGDGLLTMEKILALRLNADWVVLSACNTANGAGAGAEAISGLGRAFFYAGARALLVTLWPVETTSATALTTGLFSRQASNSKLTRAQALQQTINALIDDKGMIDSSTGRMVFSYAHPMFWAPFVLVGDGGR